MDTAELIDKIEEIEKLNPKGQEQFQIKANAFYVLSLQFVKNYIGKDTEFYKSILNFSKIYSDISTDKVYAASSILSSVKSYLQLNLVFLKTENYQTKIDIISDFICQAIELSNDKNFHPAASAILLGAALEEFLKQLAELNSIDLQNVKKTIDPISLKLYEQKIITKQDLKDITSWAGLRNDATHGNFEQVNDRKRIQNAIEGVNLFMRKFNP